MARPISIPLLRALAAVSLAGVVLTAVAGCASPDAGAPDEVSIRVASVGFDPQLQSPVVLLVEEQSPGRQLPIWIGMFEARSIAFALEAVPQPRPNAHDLLAAVMRELGGHLARVVITALREGTYYAELAIERDGRTLPIDARPSDAIALALRTGTPLYARRAVLDAEPPRGPGTQASLRGSARATRPWR
jgi:bifunctional DNase/RNase